MSVPADSPLKRTSLHATHVALGARMVPFGGWDMPVEYSGISAEHQAVRTAAGLFDVSHMGQIELAGPNALAAVQHLTSNDAAKLQVGQAQYSALTTPEGTFVDDVLVYRMGPSHFLLVVNASNIEKDHAWIVAQRRGGRRGRRRQLERPLRADRGAGAEGARHRPVAHRRRPLETIKYYWFAHGEVAGVRGTVSRTGYTGEDGFEIFVPPQFAPSAVDGAARRRARTDGLMPVRPRRARHAAARGGDAPLRQRHGRDRPRSLECDLGWIVGWNKAGVPRPRGAARARRPRASPGRSSASRWSTAAIARHGLRRPSRRAPRSAR